MAEQAVLTRPTMGKQRGETRRDDVAVKMDRQITDDARIAAAVKRVSLAEYLSEIVRPIVARDLEEYRKGGGVAPPARPKGRPKK